MKPWMAVALVALVAGCTTNATDPTTVADAPAATTDPPPPTLPPLPASNGTLLGWGILGNTTTQASSLTFWVHATAPVAFALHYNGTEVAAHAVLEGNRSFVVPLEYGTRGLGATAGSQAGSWTWNATATRLAATELTIDYCVFHPEAGGSARSTNHTLWVNVDSRPSQTEYDAVGATRIDRYTAHDQLHEFALSTGTVIDITWSASFQSFSVDRIDGAGNPVSSSAPPYWLYSVNGSDAPVGMSLQVLKPGDDVRWRLSNLGPPCE